MNKYINKVNTPQREKSEAELKSFLAGKAI